jgi:hypothetical protein
MPARVRVLGDLLAKHLAQAAMTGDNGSIAPSSASGISRTRND